jgi:hypothetical protein
MTTKFEPRSLRALLSLPEDKDFLAPVAIKGPTGLVGLEQILDYLNTEENRLACIAYSENSKPLVLFDGAKDDNKTVLLAMGEDLGFKIVKPTTKTKLDFSSTLTQEFDLLKASFFATGVRESLPSKEGSLSVVPLCLLPQEWLGHGIVEGEEEQNSMFCLDTLANNLACRFQSLKLSRENASESLFLQNLASFASVRAPETFEVPEEFIFSDLSEKVGKTSMSYKKMKASLEQIQADIKKLEETDKSDDQGDEDSSVDNEQSDMEDEDSAADELRNSIKNATEKSRNRKRSLEEKIPKKNRKKNGNGTPLSKDLEDETNPKTPSKYLRAKSMMDMDLFMAPSAMDLEKLSRASQIQKVLSKRGILDSYISNGREDDHRSFSKQVNGTFPNGLNDVFTDIISRNSSEKDLGRAIYRAALALLQKTDPFMDKHIQPCTKSTAQLFQGEIFEDDRFQSFDEITGLSFMSIRTDKKNESKINGLSLQIPFTVHDLLFQIKVLIAYMACVLSADPEGDIDPLNLGRPKQSSVVFILQSIYNGINRNKSTIESVYRSVEAKKDICLRIHNYFLRMVFDFALDPHTDLKHSDIKIPVVESIINMNYIPPKQKQGDGKGGRHRRGGGNGGNGGNNDNGQRGGRGKGFFSCDFHKAMQAAKAKKDVPQIENKPACIVCAVNGDHSCRSKSRNLFHGAFTDSHVEDFVKFGTSNGFEVKKRG